jgi:hypothetical protein
MISCYIRRRRHKTERHTHLTEQTTNCYKVREQTQRDK